MFLSDVHFCSFYKNIFSNGVGVAVAFDITLLWCHSMGLLERKELYPLFLLFREIQDTSLKLTPNDTLSPSLQPTPLLIYAPATPVNTHRCSIYTHLSTVYNPTLPFLLSMHLTSANTPLCLQRGIYWLGVYRLNQTIDATNFIRKWQHITCNLRTWGFSQASTWHQIEIQHIYKKIVWQTYKLTSANHWALGWRHRIGLLLSEATTRQVSLTDI